ncbi:ATP-binding protein, partial [Streptomyces sp. GXMU-J5]|nr:ATP-binding protein [Streptomyces beihaiensis]
PVAPGPAAPAPAPLPQRTAGDGRPTPADALPGIRSADRARPENPDDPTAPRGDAVRGTMGRPRLPRRRAQEHLAPQLRGGPAKPDADAAAEPAGHDPGLMAAFQRGITLAEAAEPRAVPPEHSRDDHGERHSPGHGGGRTDQGGAG